MVAVVGEMVGELIRYRGLLAMLAWRDIRVRYKQSILGVAWAFLMPLIQTLVLWAIVQFGPMNIEARDRDYMPALLFVLSGVIPWSLFNSTLAASVESLTRNSRLVTKIYFPREVFPLGTVAGAIVDFSISLTILIPVYAFYAVKSQGIISEPHVHVTPMLAVLPFILIIQLLLVAGLSLIVSMANLFFRDVKYLMTFVLQLWFFATNVMYPIKFEHHPALRWLASANPMIAILNAYRDCLMGNGLHDAAGLAISAVVAVLVFFGGWRAFHEAEFKFAEYV